MLLVVTNADADGHDAGWGHPEQPARTHAALAGLQAAGLGDAVVARPPRPAATDELIRVHAPSHVAALAELDRVGGGRIDADTRTSPGSWRTALDAAGAGLVAVERLQAGEATAALVLVRPPGHHAGPARASGFCLVNNVAVAAAALADAGERVAILDWDVHHGNGTQEIFWEDGRVLFASFHQWGLYPGTGGFDEVGQGAGEGGIVNVPLPEGTTGDAIRMGFDELVAPALDHFAPTWILVSAGFDGHRDDPLGGWGLTAADYADLASRVAGWVPPGRLACFLEGGYDLDAVAASTGAVAGALLGQEVAGEGRSSGLCGRDDVVAIADWRRRQPWYDA